MWSKILTSLLFISKAHGWGYIRGENGPTTWPDPSCQTGDFQSPIDIPKNVTYVDTSEWLPFQFTHYERKLRSMKAKNTGQGFKVTFGVEGCNDKLPKISQGNLPAEFELAQFHFHWGWYHNKGSEHTIHGRQSAAELHLVHYNVKCGRDFDQAVTECDDDKDTLAVLGIMIEEGPENPKFDHILDELYKIKDVNEEEYLHPISPMDLLPEKTTEFWRYQGSLTTPGNIGGADCAEIVIWTVFKDKVTLSRRQLEKFFKINDEDGNDLRDSFRPPQPLAGREVYFADLDFKCNDRSEWKRDDYCSIASKETKGEFDFNDAVHECTGYYYDEDVIATGLIPVGKLRCLRNKYAYDSDVMRPLDDDLCQRYYRVNGIKDHDGIWREYPSGRRISFHHFPMFREHHGGQGDTLIWDALEDRLFIDDKRDKYNAICYKQYQTSCNCDYELEHECSDAGDCMNGVCQCDEGFEGKLCQLAPLKMYDFVEIGYDFDEVTDSRLGVECDIESFQTFSGMPDAEWDGGQRCDYVFGTPICCGGEIDDTGVDMTDICGLYDCFNHRWVQFKDYPESEVEEKAYTVVRNNGRDIGWLMAGGEYSPYLYWLDEDFTWTCLNTMMPIPRNEHCLVQINDCEIAFIGGEDNVDDDYVEQIDIYNYKTNSWRVGPNILDGGDYYMKCGTIRNKQTQHTTVIYRGYSEYLYAWDIQKDTIIDLESEFGSDFEDPDGGYNQGKLVNLDENQLAQLANDDEEIYRIDLENGYRELDKFHEENEHDDGSFILAPRNTFKCTGYN